MVDRHCDRTRTLACHIYKHRPSHSMRKTKSVCAAAFQTREY